MIPDINNKNLQKRAVNCIAQGALTNSKRPECLIKGIYPTHIKRGYKCYLVDADSRKYIDYICALGTNYFGYGNYKITQAVADTLSRGAVFSIGSELEVLFAEEIKGKFPFIEKIKILKEGSAGCSAAIKIARTYTKRQHVLTQGYHGWHDVFVTPDDPAAGVVATGAAHRVSNLEDINFKSVAAVILEPVLLDATDTRRAWLQRLRELTARAGALLIFDETITAMRFQDYSVAKHWSILPDLWVGGKALGGGLPISIVGGPGDIMDADYFVSSTWAGDLSGIAGTRKALELVTNDYHPNSLWHNGQEFLNQFNSLSEFIKIDGYSVRGRFVGNERFKNLFFQEMCKAGVLFGPSWFYNLDLHKELNNVLDIAKTVIKRIINRQCQLEGKPMRQPQSEKQRQ